MSSIPPPGFPPPDQPVQRASPAPPPARPDRNRLKLLIAGAVAVTAGFVAYTLFLGPDEGPEGLNPIAQAAERTAAIPGSRMSMTADASFPQLGARMVMSGSGVTNGRTDRGRIEMNGHYEGGPAQLPDFSMVGVNEGYTMYMSSSLFSAALPAGKSWIKLESTSEEIEQASFSNVDPTQQLDSLRGVTDDFTTVGPERVRGVVTTHYQATIDYRLYADALREEGLDDAAEQVESTLDGIESSPVDVWIDDEQRIRRMDLSIAMPEGAGEMTVSLEVYDFGISPRIDLPSASEVIDAQELAGGLLEST